MNTQDKGWSWQRGALILTLATVFAAAPTGISARQSGKSDLLVQESQYNKGVREWFSSQKGSSLLGSRRWVEITLQDAVLRALSENLNLKGIRLNERVAEHVMAANAAAFDAVINAGLGGSVSKSFNRTERDMGYKKDTVPCVPGVPPITTYPGSTATTTSGCNDPDAAAGGPTAGLPLYTVYADGEVVSYLRFDQQRPAGYYPTTIKASEEGKYGTSEFSTFNIGLTDPLPWGMSANVTQSTTYKQTYFDLKGGTKDPTFESYERPWASALSASFNTPMPGGKEFGTTSSREVNLEQSAFGRDQAGISSQGRANDLVGQVESAYWNLVNAVGNLDASSHYRKTIEALVNKTNRMFDVGRVTVSSKSQVEADFARAQGNETQAANSVVQASHSLNQLLNFQDDTLFLPVGYATVLQSVVDVSLEDALETGRRENSQNRMEEVGISSSALTLQQRQQQTRPDVNLTVTVSARQSGRFNYAEYTESMSNLFDPDSVSISGTAAYRYPLFNQAAGANLAQAHEEHSRRQVQRTATGKRVDRDIMNAFVSLQSAQERVKIATRNLELAETSYGKALALQDLDDERRVTEYELLVKSNDVLNARLRKLQAMVDIKRNESALQSAMGVLERKYGGGTASTAAERPVMAAVDGNPDKGDGR